MNGQGLPNYRSNRDQLSWAWHLTDIQPFRSAKVPAAPQTLHVAIDASLASSIASDMEAVGPPERYTVNVPNFCLISTTAKVCRSSEGSSLTISERRPSKRTMMGFHPSKQLNPAVLAMGNIVRSESVQCSEGFSWRRPTIAIQLNRALEGDLRRAALDAASALPGASLRSR